MTGWWEKLRAQGLCPGCRVWHDGSACVFCFECRREQSERAKAWYRRNLTYARASKRARDARRREARA